MVMIKTGIISQDRFNQLIGLPPVWQESDWQMVDRDGKTYKMITSFNHYFTDDLINQLDAIFETEDEFQVWLNSTDIIPTFQVIRNMPDKIIDGVLYHRKADVLGFFEPEYMFKRNILKLNVAVRHYLTTVITTNPPQEVHLEQKQLYKEIILEAANDFEVTPGIGEYDYIISRIRNEDIEFVITDMVDLRIADGTIERKLDS
jgi:hypothetical protein